MHAEILVLRLLHVLGGMAWVGFATYNTFFLIPAFGEAGPAAAPVFASLQKRRLFIILPALAAVTILSGVRLLMITSNGFDAAFFGTRMGLALAGGGLMALLGFIVGMFITRPAMEKAGALSAKRASASADEQRTLDAQIARSRAVGATSSLWATVLMLVSAAAMAVARYL
jgi:uncharacterized membrane protein